MIKVTNEKINSKGTLKCQVLIDGQAATVELMPVKSISSSGKRTIPHTRMKVRALGRSGIKNNQPRNGIIGVYRIVGETNLPSGRELIFQFGKNKEYSAWVNDHNIVFMKRPRGTGGGQTGKDSSTKDNENKTKTRKLGRR
ncbi:MAG: hypothetical protein IJD39_09045 [Clostridia bacterium]|nr:hypothetical protein [Clostridia bacterium]